MYFLINRSARRTRHAALPLLCALVCACGHTQSAPGPGPNVVGQAGEGAGGASAESGGASGDDDGEVATPCEGTVAPVPKRLVRLSFGQIRNAMGLLTDETEAALLTTTYDLPEPEQRTFPPLASPREGSAFIPEIWTTSDNMAADVGSYALEHLDQLSGCGATPSEACVRRFLPELAERAYRRPLTSDDEASLLQVVSEVLTDGGTPADALRYGVYAVFESPQFLYRTELGVEPAAAGPLTSAEMASQLSFFLTDGPPDQQLLAAAAADELTDPARIAAEAERLLKTPAAQENLEAALFSYFRLSNLDTVVVDDRAFTLDVRSSMRREAQLFFANTLWSGPFSGLLTSGRTAIDASLAPLYGLGAFPPAGSQLDADGFALVDLPDARAGLLTQLGYLTARSRPDSASVVGRGLAVNAELLCGENPPFPVGLPDAVRNVPNFANATEREKSEYRTTTQPCAPCHVLFDAYGLALENFDLLGRYVTRDSQGRPIDARVTLPPLAGGQDVQSAAEMARALAARPAFRACMTKNLMAYALAEFPSDSASAPSLTTNGCAPRAVADKLAWPGATFSELVTGIASSDTLRLRAADPGAP
jgi:hypothetical protein